METLVNQSGMIESTIKFVNLDEMASKLRTIAIISQNPQTYD